MQVNSSDASPFHLTEERTQVLVGGDGVANLELDRRADLDPVADGEGLTIPHRTHHTAYQEVAPVEVQLVLVDHPAQVQALGGELPVLGRELLDHRLQLVERRDAGQLEQQVAVGGGDGHRAADRPAALRHDRVDRHVGAQQDPDRAVDVHGAIGEQAIAARPASCRGEPADHDQVGGTKGQIVDQPFDRNAEGISQQKKGAGPPGRARRRPRSDRGRPTARR